MTPAEADAVVQAAGVLAHSRANRAAALALLEGASRLVADAGRLVGYPWQQAPETWPADPWRDTPEADWTRAETDQARRAIQGAIARLRTSLATDGT